MVYIRFSAADKLAQRIRTRSTPYVLRITKDLEYDPTDDEGNTAEDIANFRAGKYSAWILSIHLLCPDHDEDCPHSRVPAELPGVAVHDGTDLTGEYTSPYFVTNADAQHEAWMLWNAFKVDAYINAAENIVDSFRYETCGSCGGDLDRHSIAPGPFGLPLTWCLDSPEDF